MTARRLRVLTYNVHKGFSLFRKYVLLEMRQALRDVSPDIVFLQEIKGLHGSTENQLTILAEEILGYHVYGQNNGHDNDHYGNAILSRWPLLRSHNVNLTNHRFERRGLLAAELEISSDFRLFTMTSHLDLTHFSRERQVDKIFDHLVGQLKLSFDYPVILAGDFNDWQRKLTRLHGAELQLREAFLDHQGDHAKTFPSLFPLLHLDRVYYRGLSVIDARILKGRPWNQLSDHLPLFVEFEFFTKT